jgi:hypothetical protein
MSRNTIGIRKASLMNVSEISGSHGGESENDCLPGCCAV